MPEKKPTRGPVPKEAVDYLKGKGLKPAFSYRDVWKEEHNTAFTVAKIMESDLLADVQKSLVQALEEGQTFRKWAKEIKPTLDKSGWSAYGDDRTRPHRLNTIFDTNMRSARTVGQWQRIERTKKTLPFLQYTLGPSERHRPHHEIWDGTILPADDPFWDTHMPLNGFGCKCGVIQMSRTVADRFGGPSEEAPPLNLEDVKNPKTGKVERIPRGIDPGFNFNAGKTRNKTLATVEKDSGALKTKIEKTIVKTSSTDDSEIASGKKSWNTRAKNK